MKNLIILMTIVFLAPLYAVDYTSYLTSEISYEVKTNHKKSPFINANPHYESYQAIDFFSNPFHLTFKDSLELESDLAASLYLESQGILHPIVYPVIVKRGENGVAKLAQAQMLFPQLHRINRIVNNDKTFFSANLYSVINFENEFPHPRTVQEKLEVTKVLFARFMLGMEFSDHKKIPDYVGRFKRHYLVKSTEGAFANFTNPTFDKEEQLLNLSLLLEEIHITDLSDEDKLFFFKEIGGFLQRQLTLQDKEKTNIFKQTESALSHNKINADINHYFEEVIQDLINTTKEMFIKTNEEQNAFDAALGSTILHSPLIRLPEVLSFNAQVLKNIHQENPADILWTLYHAKDPKTWGQFFQFYHHTNKFPHAVAEVTDTARLSYAKIFQVISDSRYDFSIQHQLAQVKSQFLTAVNPKLEETLFVYAENDLESRHISKLLAAQQAHTLKVDTIKGTKLENVLEQIEREARQLQLADIQIKRIVIIELPPAAIATEMHLREKYELITIDHHNNSGLQRYHKKSSLEQVAQLLGVRLSMEDYMVALHDSSPIHAFRDIGLNQADITRFLTYLTGKYDQTIDSFITDLKELPGQKQKTFVIYYRNVPLGLIYGQLSMHHYPEIVNLIYVTDDRIILAGNYDWIQNLRSALFREGEIKGRYYAGGDLARSSFIAQAGLTQVRKEHILSVIEQSLNVSINFNQKHSCLNNLKTFF